MRIIFALLSASLLFVALSGCEQAEKTKDSAVQKTQNAIAQAARKADEHVSTSEPSLDDDGDNKGEDASPAKTQADSRSDSASPLEEDVPEGAVAVLHATAGNEVKGNVYFQPGQPGGQGENGGLRIQTTATGLPPGDHAYHIHLYGDCSAPDGTSAGTHFNLAGSSLNPPKDIDHITGNLGILKADQNGNAEHSAQLANAALTGPKSIIGRAIIVHAKGNDQTQPPIGAAGDRLACGVIGIADVAVKP